MYIITVKGEAQASNDEGIDVDLSKLDGIECHDCFSDYMDRDLKSIISGGYLRFEYKDGKLWSITEYKSSIKLTDSEMEEVKSYTQGQWSDGIGEGFEQHPCNDDNDYISPWFHGQEITIFDNSAEIREEKLNELEK